MGYILPIPNYQYQQYRERVVKAHEVNYSFIDPVQKAAFQKELDERENVPSHNANPNAAKRKSYNPFEAQLAKISGKGMQLNKLA
ncbi:hypothetical protein [Bacillus sp. FJAT-42315]|uniref:hypothetical protein n=1 Tax=Bacillus sp. FJAT-42315 TaxID=2014077 RepID=UPI000C23E350|nr:hypothetical protein [Bacillus sp. FJAT-42315]